MTGTPQDASQDAYNATDAALSQIEGLGIALGGLVWRDFSNIDDASLAMMALVNTINENITAALELRGNGFRTGLEAIGPSA